MDNVAKACAADTGELIPVPHQGLDTRSHVIVRLVTDGNDNSTDCKGSKV